MLIKKIKKIFLSLFSITSIFVAPTVLTSCSQTNEFYFANYQSYISSDLEEMLDTEIGVINYRYYETNEVLERKFDRNYDVAVPSTYLVAKLASNDKLHKLDWTRFNLTFEDENGNIKNIENADDALNLFTKDVQEILTNIYDVDGNGKQDSNDNLLQYGVPYFLQDFIFGYKGQKVDSFHQNVDVPPTWKDIFQYMGDKVGDDKQYKKIALIDDYRTIYSIPRLIQTNGLQINPEKNDNTLIDVFEETYSHMSNYFQEPNSFLLNPDSGVILNDFADPKGSDAGIMYNGDLLYAMLGGDEYSEDLSLSPFYVQDGQEFKAHFVRPQKTLLALDMLVINKNTKFLDKSYEMVKMIGLDGSSSEQDIWEEDEEGNYVYGPMINFDYVLYTSPLQSIHDYVNFGDAPDTEENYKYFDYLIEDYQYSQEFVDMCVDIFNIKTHPSPDNMIELSISELNKSNMYYGYTRIKAKL